MNDEQTQKKRGIPDSLFTADKAIALSYDGQTAPKVSAKGEHELAQAIIQLALQHEVPIYENASLFSWLSQLDLDDEIPEGMYRVIAEILTFVYQLEGKSPDQQTDSGKSGID